MENTFLVIMTALCSGLIATLVTIWWQNKSQEKKEKEKIFTILMSKRYDFTVKESVEALNMIDVVFYNSIKVRDAWKEFLDAVNKKGSPINDKYLRLLELIADDIGYKDICWEDIKQFYYPVGLANRRQDEDVLRKVQIDVALAQMKRDEQENLVEAKD